MGVHGPVPKRDAERRRENKPEVPTETVPMPGKVKPPSCPTNLHPLARSWYRSLATSGQSKFYEPSDWQEARVLATVLSKALTSGKPVAQLIAIWQTGAAQLLTTEGARRRMRMEIERGAKPSLASVSLMDEYREKLGG